MGLSVGEGHARPIRGRGASWARGDLSSGGIASLEKQAMRITLMSYVVRQTLRLPLMCYVVKCYVVCAYA